MRSRRSALATAATHAPWKDSLPPQIAHELDLALLAESELNEAVDVAVVGAGVAGLSAALAAGSAGARVALLEAGAVIGAGATARNAGILSAGINMGLADLPAGSPHAEMWPTTTRVLLDLVNEANSPQALLSATLTGSLSLAESAEAARRLAREAKARTRLGLRAEMWTAAQVADWTTGRLNTRTVRAALWLPDEGRIQPVSLLAHLAHQARGTGVRLIGNAQVVAYEVEEAGGRTASWRLHLVDGGTIKARAVIVAVGPTAAPTARIVALAFGADLPDAFPLFWDAAPYTYCDFRPGDGRLVVSGGRYAPPGHRSADASYHTRLAEAARHWLPELGEVEPTHAWAVDLAVGKEMAPELRELGGAAPGLAIEGLGALGVLPGIVLGRRAGEQLALRLSA